MQSIHTIGRRARLLLAALCTLIALGSCSDSLSEIGKSVMPSDDGISIKTASFDVNVATGYRDSVYVRTGYPLLGNITDPDFGQVNAGYLAQFYSSTKISLNTYDSSDSLIFDILKTSAPRELGMDPDNRYKAWDSIIGNRIDSMTIRIYYNSYYGDSLTPMQVSVYSLNPEVDFTTLPESEFYSNNDFSKYYTEENLIGQKAFTAANRELSDSVRSLSGYTPYIEIRLKDELKERFFRKLVEAEVARDEKNPHHTEYTDVFSDISELRKSLLSGVCVKPTYGDGCMIKVYYTAVYFFFSSYHRYDVDGTLLRNADDDADSTYTTSHVKYLAVTPDIIQMSGYQFNDPNKERRMQEQDTTFITSPMGYYTTLDLPVGRIISTMMEDKNRLEGDSTYFLNSANFYLQCFKPEGTLLSATPAPQVLMVEESDITSFFEEGKLPDSETSCYASYVADSVPNGNYNDPKSGVYYYSFGNIYSVITGLAKLHGWSKEKNTPIDPNLTVRMAVLPVDVTVNKTYGTVLSLSNYILPTAAKIKRNSGLQNIQMIYTIAGDATKED